MQIKSLVAPTVLFAAGSFATAGHATAVDITATDGGTPIYLPGLAAAQFVYDIDTTTVPPIAGSTKYYIKANAPGAAVACCLTAGTSASSLAYSGSEETAFAPSGGTVVATPGDYALRYLDNGVTRYASATVDSSARIVDITVLGSAVPEPATWAQAIVGLGLAGAALRRARRRQAGAPAIA